MYPSWRFRMLMYLICPLLHKTLINTRSQNNPKYFTSYHQKMHDKSWTLLRFNSSLLNINIDWQFIPEKWKLLRSNEHVFDKPYQYCLLLVSTCWNLTHWVNNEHKWNVCNIIRGLRRFSRPFLKFRATPFTPFVGKVLSKGEPLYTV